jgi:hypothetical protein
VESSFPRGSSRPIRSVSSSIPIVRATLRKRQRTKAFACRWKNAAGHSLPRSRRMPHDVIMGCGPLITSAQNVHRTNEPIANKNLAPREERHLIASDRNILAKGVRARLRAALGCAIVA